VVRRVALGLLLLAPLLLIGCGSELPDGAIAQVGTVLVSQDQFNEMSAAYQATGKAPDKSSDPQEYQLFQRALAEHLVVLEVLRQEATDFSVTVTDSDVQTQLDQVMQMFQGDQAKFDEALKSQHVTLNQLKESIREDLWVERMKDAVTGNVTVTEDEVQAYYNAHKSQYVEPESRDVKHILISPFAKLVDNTIATTATQEEWDAAKSEAEKVRSEIQNGADFASEAEKYSDDAATRDSGGELGVVVRGQMVPEFEEAVFSLQKGELSEPVKTQYGYHLIVVNDITPERQLAFDQVKETIRTALLTQKQESTWDAWLAQKEAELGVTYRSGYAPPTPTTATTLKPGAKTTTSAGTGSSGQ
jgi:parvulin-like peptidyl-prolyl isomerase